MEGIIRIICDDFDSIDVQGFGGERTDNKFVNNYLSFECEDLKPKIKEAMHSVVSLIDEKPLNEKGYEVSELVFNLNINADGKVSLFSIASGGVSVQSGITIKIVKKKT